MKPRLPSGFYNKTEEAYAARLEMLRQAGSIIAYFYELVKFNLADRTTYTPDFLVVFGDHFEIHEVKGFWRNDARVKIKVAARLFPYFDWYGVKKEKKEWVFEKF